MNAIEFAINMEIDGEKYYTEQAGLNQDNSVGVVCLILSKAEHGHEQILRKKLSQLPYELPDKDSYASLKNVFSDLGRFKSEINATPSQLEFYRTALALEQKSIDFYKGLLTDTAEQHEKDLFQYLVDQETQHFTLLNELVTMLRHAEDWVESPEFGLRNETY